tara:strand:- start:37 stop:207 length:171 start_codon:yes stop_codon:yes gene_type:complete
MENSNINPIDILRLLSELEGSSQLLKQMGFVEEMEMINLMKKRFYKMYFQLKKSGL